MSGSDAVIRVVPIVNARGLHARASAKLTRLAVKFDADITVSKDGYTVSARSIMGLLTLGAAMGSSIELKATGAQATAAIDALSELVARKFDEE